MAPKMPKALLRSAGSVNVVVSSDRIAGASSAANRPCTARAPMSMPTSTEAPPMAEATAKPIMPTMKTHLRPTTSAMRPPISSSEPKASAYAVTIHCRALSENARSVWAVGSAMFTIVASSTTISCAMPRTARIHQRLVLLAATEDVVVDVFSRVVVMWALLR